MFVGLHAIQNKAAGTAALPGERMRRAGTNAARLAARKFAVGLAPAIALSGVARAQEAASRLDEYMTAATGSVTSLILHNPGGKNIPGNNVK
jgi:hypothetical protein